MPSRFEIYVGNDNVLEIDGFRDATTTPTSAGTYLNSQTGLIVHIVDSASAVISGGTAIAMSYVSGSSGKYRAQLPDTLPLSARTKYRGIIIADSGTNKMGKWEVGLIAYTRRQGE